MSLILIGIILTIFFFLYRKFWKIEEIPLTQKIFYGATFIPISIGFFCGILFQFVIIYELTLIIYFFIASQILLIMISESFGDKAVLKLRYGRIILYSFGYGLGMIGIFFLYYLIILFINTFRFSTPFYVDWNGILFLIVGILIFILSLWGYYNEEKYSLHEIKGEMKITALTFTNIALWIFSLFNTILGIMLVVDLLFWRYSGPDLHYIAAVFYFIIGIYLFNLSTQKMLKYKKQLNKKIKMVKLT